ncbi:MAG TPA: TspO/MBR family protein [Peptostreptococcaceae bacterium]|nr:TspO/MBR family protein [Peptostreptococcaceae bacterium]
MIISVKDVRNFLISILIPLLVGATSYMLSRIIGKIANVAMYSDLIKPTFAPPALVFPIVWTILYILMGISAYKIWKKGYYKIPVRDSLFYYNLQLFLNFIWSILFFGLGLRLTALIDLLLLIVVVIIMNLKFYKLNKKTAYLNLPYLLWLTYAGVLNYYVWMLNK